MTTSSDIGVYGERWNVHCEKKHSAREGSFACLCPAIQRRILSERAVHAPPIKPHHILVALFLAEGHFWDNNSSHRLSIQERGFSFATFGNFQTENNGLKLFALCRSSTSASCDCPSQTQGMLCGGCCST